MNSPSARIGYARVSTADQNPDTQIAALTAAGCTMVRTETGSGTTLAGRPELRTILDFIHPGETLVVTRIDRLARSMRDLQVIVATLKDKGAHLAGLCCKLAEELKVVSHGKGFASCFPDCLATPHLREVCNRARTCPPRFGRLRTVRTGTCIARPCGISVPVESAMRERLGLRGHERNLPVPDLKSLNNLYLILVFLVPGLIVLFVRSQFVAGRRPSHSAAILSYLTEAQNVTA